MARKHMGDRSICFEKDIFMVGNASVAGKNEHEGPYADYFDLNTEDALFGEKTFEKAERKMFETAVTIALNNAQKGIDDIHYMVGGDLLNQIISANYTARDFGIPFIGLYGACSTMAESLIVGSMLIDGEFARDVLCLTGSHYATAERQFRYPLELGTPKPPTAQSTVTAAGATVLSENQGKLPIVITRATVGRVVDLGIDDANDMGSAMAPAAAETIVTHFEDFCIKPDYYDVIVTGDLGSFGSSTMLEMCEKGGFRITEKHRDCGVMIYRGMKGVNCGGSGCGCGGALLNGFFVKEMAAGKINKMLFIATGALMSPTSSLQGDTIPSVAHAVAIERRG